MPYLLALDQGTTSSRSIVFDLDGRVCAQAQLEITQHYPQPGWVEHCPEQIWQTQLETARAALAAAGVRAQQICALGITNQRETTLLWERSTGVPLARAIVWQDRRTSADCAALQAAGHAPLVQARTGLRLDPYFSATKLRWLLQHVPGARQRAERGELCFGTVDSWLLWRLSGAALHATDVSNAARTLLWNLEQQGWDDELLQRFGIPRALLPEVRPSSADYGLTLPEWLGAPVRIGGVAGDQQAALFGQGCHQAGMVKNTYGTGCFMLMHTGARVLTSQHGLISTAAAQPPCAPAGALHYALQQSPQNAPQNVPQYALEGSVFMGGAVVQWLRDGLRAINSSSEVQALAQSVPDAGGVVLVPAFTGLGAPYWRADARACITGLTRGSTLAHIARAALESIAFQSAALLQAMLQDAQAAGVAAPSALRVDGGACGNDLLLQFQADLLGLPVQRPAVLESTALGAAQLAGLQAGVYAGLDELAQQWRCARSFYPTLSRAQAQARMAEWEHAVRQTLTPTQASQ